MLRPGLSIYQANKGHMSRLLILVLLKLDFTNSQDWSEYWKNKLKEYKVIPDILSSEPPQALGAIYHIFIVNFGVPLLPIQFQDEPNRMEWPTEDHALYTLVVTGLDAPTGQNASNREWLHWLIVNIPGFQWKFGTKIVDYQGDSRNYGPGPHRCVFLAFKQPLRQKMIFNENRIRNGANDSLRANFSTAAFVKKYNLSEPVAANFFVFESEFSNAVPSVQI